MLYFVPLWVTTFDSVVLGRRVDSKAAARAALKLSPLLIM